MKHLRDRITLLPIIVLDGICVFAPIPEPAPISILRPLPKETYRFITLIFPHFLNILLHKKQRNLLLGFPNTIEYESGRCVAIP